MKSLISIPPPSIVTFFVLLFACVLKFPQLLVRRRGSFTPDQAKLGGNNFQIEELRLKAEADRVKAESDVRTTLLQGLAGLVLLGGAFAAWGQLNVAHEGQVTDRFTKAIAQLGDDKHLAVRLGGIYALERIMKDSEKDQGAIVGVLATFVRENAPWKDAQENASRPSTDIQTILIVLGRRTPKGDDLLTLLGTNLRRTNLKGAHLENAELSYAHLEEAVLIDAHLKNARLFGTHLERARLDGAHLEGVDLSGALGLVQEQLKPARCNSKTLLPPALKGACGP